MNFFEIFIFLLTTKIRRAKMKLTVEGVNKKWSIQWKKLPA